VSGRIPGDDDDTAQPVLANTAEAAARTFSRNLVADADLDKDRVASLKADHGTTCFVITCEQIGQVEPDLLPLLREAADRLQKLNNDAEDWARSCEDPKAERAACRVTDKLITRLYQAAATGAHT